MPKGLINKILRMYFLLLMKIAVDLRSLQSGTVSGVENYTRNLVENLLIQDKQNSYKLFYNGFKPLSLEEFRFINAEVIRGRKPNKLLNLGLKMNFFNFTGLVGDFDVLFMPNLNTVNLNLESKLAITVHDMSPIIAPEFYDMKRRLWHRFLNIKKILSRADIIFTVSNYTKSDILMLYNIHERKIKVIYPGVDPEVFYSDIQISALRRARNVYGLPGEFFLFLNTLEPRKNLIGAIEAFEQIQSRAHLVIAGKKGWKTAPILRRIKSSIKKDKIHYLGYLKEEDKPAVLKMAKALIYPSFYEGFGFQPLEAMAVGTPVIASQITALPEVVGDAGLLVNPYNTRDLVKAMAEVGRDEILREFLIKKGLERVSQFDWKITASQTLHYLEALK